MATTEIQDRTKIQRGRSHQVRGGEPGMKVAAGMGGWIGVATQEKQGGTEIPRGGNY